MNDEDTVEKRRQRSDEARRAAMRQKVLQQKERDRQIALDISNVDKKATKRIVFEDSDEEDEIEKPTENGEKKASSSSSKRPKLFDSEGEEEEELGDEFQIKNRHSGPKGEQLMKMEARFNSDPRFKLDDKFAESESDDDVVENTDKQEMKIEKDKNRELLSKILGKSVEEKKPTTTETATLKARPFTRFDPENPEHVAWMKEFEASKNPQKSKKPTESKETPEISDNEDESKSEDDNSKNRRDKDDDKEEEESDDNYEKAEIYFKMDEKFSAEMKERKENEESTNGGFSFLSMMGRTYKDEPVENEAETVSKEKDAGTEKKKEKDSKKEEKIERALLKVKVTTKFFVDPLTDEKIKSLAANFRRTQTVEKVIDKWAPHRDAIFKLWKKQRRDAVKKQKESFFTNGKRKRKAENEDEESIVDGS